MNLLIKYADDTKLFVVPSDSDLDLTEKFNNVIKWAAEKKWNSSLQKTKEFVFWQPNPKPVVLVQPIPLQQIEELSNANF